MHGYKWPINCTRTRTGLTWATSAIIAPNNRNFPASELTTGPNLPTDDLAAVMVGIYGR